jgi:hypothetical protein
MDTGNTRKTCSRCLSWPAKEEICTECIGELLELHNYRIGWKVALEIENEERDGRNISIEIQ